jgi:predicted dehydrogenase
MTLAAARAGKHVLCEKPIALNATEAAQLREFAGKVHIMEAFMVRFHPQWLTVRERVRSGVLGEVRQLQAFFSYFNREPDNIRNKLDIGGGALYDIGCYPVVIGRFLYGTEPLRVIALFDRDPNYQTDRSVSALLDFGGGRQMDFTVSTQTVPYQRVQICGTQKRIEVHIPFNSPLSASTPISTDDGSSLDGQSVRAETIPACDMYTLEIDALSQAVLGKAPLVYGVEDAVLNMRVLDALFESEKTNAWVQVSART